MYDVVLNLNSKGHHLLINHVIHDKIIKNGTWGFKDDVGRVIKDIKEMLDYLQYEIRYSQHMMTNKPYEVIYVFDSDRDAFYFKLTYV